MSLVRMVARPMLASIFIAQGAKKLRDPDAATAAAKPVADRITPLLDKYAPQVPTDTRSLVRVNAGVQVGAGLMLATGRLPRMSSLVLAASMVPTTVAEHPFWQADDPAERSRQRTSFFKNVGIIGGLLLSGVDTEGRPGLRWRAKRAAADTRRAARHAKRDAGRTARLARAEATSKAKGVVHR
jgi:putative oxidoreductase